MLRCKICNGKPKVAVDLKDFARVTVTCPNCGTRTRCWYQEIVPKLDMVPCDDLVDRLTTEAKRRWDFLMECECEYRKVIPVGVLCRNPDDCPHLYYHQNAGGDHRMCGRDRDQLDSDDASDR